VSLNTQSDIMISYNTYPASVLVLDICGGEALVLLPDEFVELIFLILADLTLHKNKNKNSKFLAPCLSYLRRT
jgi:hypothetical protein